jgi:ABC-type iron transport system FetAB ATPase subunit
MLESEQNLVLSSPSGTGKTLILRALADLDFHQGEVFLEGREQSQYPVTEWRRNVAYLPAESAWWSDEVGDHFGHEEEVNWAALGFDATVRDWAISRLSSGERQRLAVLRVLLNRPRVLLLDEPTANLDTDNTNRVEQLIADYLVEASAAAVWVSHGVDQQKRLSGRILTMVDGRWQEQVND